MFLVKSVGNKFLNRGKGDAEVGGEFFDGDDLVFLFVECSSDFVDEVAAVAFAFASDALDVFWVNAETSDSWFHKFCFFW